MEQEARENTSAGTRETGQKTTDVMVVDLESYVNVEINMEKNGISEVGPGIFGISQGLCDVFSCSLLKSLG